VTRTEEFEGVRPLLFAIARRILGSASEAEAAVEATRLRWVDTSARPASVEGHLAAEVTRISTDALQSAHGRQASLEPWPSGPIPGALGFLGGADADPERPAELADSLLTAALLLMERLSPLERAVFVLKEALGCGVEEIASALDCSQEACGQLLDSLAATSDGGAEPLPWPTYTAGAKNVAWLLSAIVSPLVRIGVALEMCETNGRPGAHFRDRNGRILSSMALDLRDGQIAAVHLVVHCEQSVYMDPVAEAYAVLREANRAE
jgi:RNA polymerase sigma-70 factor, ECF subfamily